MSVDCGGYASALVDVNGSWDPVARVYQPACEVQEQWVACAWACMLMSELLIFAPPTCAHSSSSPLAAPDDSSKQMMGIPLA